MELQQLLIRRPFACPKWVAVMLVVIAVAACSEQPWNSPYPARQAGHNILYSSFSERPKHLDPAQSYSSNEVVFTGQIYEPPLQYHFLKRPYELEPLTAGAMPRPYYLDQAGQRLADDSAAAAIAFSVYDIEIKPGIRYQPHPAFARDAQGRYLYHGLSATDLDGINTLADFREAGSRELVAADYVYQIKRLAHPRLHSPIFGLMSEYIDGLHEYAQTLKQADERQQSRQPQNLFLDLRDYPLSGVQVLDRYRYRVKIRGKYPQFLY